MFLACLIYAICVNIDSFNVGLSYGIKNIQVKSFTSKLILFITSLVLISISVILGYFFSNLFSEKAVDIFRLHDYLFNGYLDVISGIKKKRKKRI